MTTLKADTITGTSGITTFSLSPTLPTQAYTTNNDFLATTASANGLTTSTHLTTDTTQTMVGSQTFVTLPTTIASIDNTGTIQVGSATDEVRLGNSATRTLTINGILQSLAGFTNFCVSSNSTAGGTAGMITVQKLQTGRVNLTGNIATYPTVVFVDVVFTDPVTLALSPFTSTPVIGLSQTSLNSTILSPIYNYWVTNVTNTGFRMNTYNPTLDNKYMNWVAVGI